MSETGALSSEVRDGMRIDWDVPIVMDDGTVLRADLFRPTRDDVPLPVLLTYGPYGKGLRFCENHAEQWASMIERFPEITHNSTGKYIAWETPDPERWVSWGYAYMRVDARGAGRSPGYLDPHSPREIRDTAACVDWAGEQAWSNGKVGILGISYYAVNAWLVASLQDGARHLAAVCPWEGLTDRYRDSMRHGGIRTTYIKNWWNARVVPIQHGVGERGERSSNTGELVSGPETLTDAELAANRTDSVRDHSGHHVEDDWTRARSVVFENLTVPFLSAANWGGAALHLRGGVEAFVRAATPDKWLEVHGLEHWTHFYTDYGLALQRRFFDRFLKGDPSRWSDEPRVLLNVRRPGGAFTLRTESAWPIPRTQWTPLFIDLAQGDLTATPPEERVGQCSFDALGPGVTFRGAPLTEELEITGPVAARLSVSSTTADADIFLVLHVLDPDGTEVTFQGAQDPRSCVGKGWLRASHRKLDPELSQEYRPYHTHDELQPLIPGEVYDLDVEIWPTSIVIPVGHRIALSVLGRDYFHPEDGTEFDNFGLRGVRGGSGSFVHDDPEDRPSAVYGGVTTIHHRPDRPNRILLPVIPGDAPQADGLTN